MLTAIESGCWRCTITSLACGMWPVLWELIHFGRTRRATCLKIHGVLGCGGTGESLHCSLSAMAFGYPDYELRRIAQEAKEHSSGIPLLSARFRPVSGSFALEEQKATRTSALGEDFCWQAN